MMSLVSEKSEQSPPEPYWGGARGAAQELTKEDKATIQAFSFVK